MFSWMFPKIYWYPKMDGENNGKTLLNWMIWGYHYFWKPPPKDGMLKISVSIPLEAWHLMLLLHLKIPGARKHRIIFLGGKGYVSLWLKYGLYRNVYSFNRLRTSSVNSACGLFSKVWKISLFSYEALGRQKRSELTEIDLEMDRTQNSSHVAENQD